MEGGKSKIKVPASSGEGPIPGSRFLISSHGGRGELALWGLFPKDIRPIHEGSTQDLITFQRPHFLIPLSLGSGFQLMNWGWLVRNSNIQTTAKIKGVKVEKEKMKLSP